MLRLLACGDDQRSNQAIVFGNVRINAQMQLGLCQR
jgi:hypothetical protein